MCGAQKYSIFKDDGKEVISNILSSKKRNKERGKQ
jgi:hypothetical protein